MQGVEGGGMIHSQETTSQTNGQAEGRARVFDNVVYDLSFPLCYGGKGWPPPPRITCRGSSHNPLLCFVGSVLPAQQSNAPLYAAHRVMFR